MTTLLPTTTFVEVTSPCEGLHHWPEAPADEGYLRTPHRHTFVATVRLQVFHDDRDIEINAFARWLGQVWTTLASARHDTSGGPLLDFDSRSCEQLAQSLAQLTLDRYGHQREITITVLEDNVLGGGISYQPQPTHPRTGHA
jgi:hypothetical protein